MRLPSLLVVVVLGLSSCAPDLKSYLDSHQADVKALRERFAKGSALVETLPEAPATNEACVTSAPLVLNQFPSKSFTVGNVAVLSLEDAKAAASGLPSVTNSLGTSIGGGEQSTMTVLDWALRPSASKADDRIRQAVDATLRLPYAVVLRRRDAPGAVEVDAFLVDLQKADVRCSRHFSDRADGQAAEEKKITGGGEADNSFRVTQTDRMKASLMQQLTSSLREDFKIRW